MNTATRVLNHGSTLARKQTQIKVTFSGFLMILLAVAIMCTAFSIIYTKDLNRRLFFQYQQLQQQEQQYQMQWGKLLLEQSTWSTQARVEQIAQQRLNMVMPNSQNIVVVNN